MNTRRLLNILCAALCFVGLFSEVGFAADQTPTPSMKRFNVQNMVTQTVTADIAAEYTPTNFLEERRCIDGRLVKDMPKETDFVEYWVNFECTYCYVTEPVLAQRENPNMCIIVRHSPNQVYGESLKKALSYEALQSVSPNAANRYWESVYPKTRLALPIPSEGALLTAMQEASIDSEAFAKILEEQATKTVEGDIMAAQGRISSTPTYTLAGIRFGSCDFKAGDLITALGLAKRARSGDDDAKTKIIEIITNGHLGETTL